MGVRLLALVGCRPGLVSMIIRTLATAVADTRIISATIEWEDRPYPEQVLEFEINDGGLTEPHQFDETCADAFLAACFPLAALHGESRVRIEERPCPMLSEGLRTAHAWWASWGGCLLGLRQSRPRLADGVGTLTPHDAPYPVCREAWMASIC